MPPARAKSKNDSTANLGFEAKLWASADALRNNMDAAEYKHVVLGLIFLKYISDAFEEHRAKLEAERAQGADPEDADEYRAVNIFWVPKEARWEVKTIGEVCEFAYGKSLKADERQFGPIPVFGSNGQVGWHNESLVKGPGIIVGRKGNPGTVVWSQTDFFPIDTTFYVIPKGNLKSLHYLFHVLLELNLSTLGADSAVPGLNRNIAYLTKVSVPPSVLIASFDKQVAVIAKKIAANDEQSRTLAALRDALLPKLVSEELQVKDVDKFIA